MGATSCCSSPEESVTVEESESDESESVEPDEPDEDELEELAEDELVELEESDELVKLAELVVWLGAELTETRRRRPARECERTREFISILFSLASLRFAGDKNPACPAPRRENVTTSP